MAINAETRKFIENIAKKEDAEAQLQKYLDEIMKEFNAAKPAPNKYFDTQPAVSLKEAAFNLVHCLCHVNKDFFCGFTEVELDSMAQSLTDSFYSAFGPVNEVEEDAVKKLIKLMKW